MDSPYIPKTKGNDEIIQAIDSGILKEVSIGCAAGEVKCSVCGESLNHLSLIHIWVISTVTIVIKYRASFRYVPVTGGK